jgi:phosphate transport system ATP-binding protein
MSNPHPTPPAATTEPTTGPELEPAATASVALPWTSGSDITTVLPPTTGLGAATGLEQDAAPVEPATAPGGFAAVTGEAASTRERSRRRTEPRGWSFGRRRDQGSGEAEPGAAIGQLFGDATTAGVTEVLPSVPQSPEPADYPTAPLAGGSMGFAPPAPRGDLASLEARHITAWFGDHQVLDRVSLTMPAGVVTSLIGPSGCGKSTFLRILNRMHELVPSASLAGEVLLDGDDIYDPRRRLVDARKHIGMVFQKPNPFPAMSIYDNVIAGLALTGTKASRDEKDYLVERSLMSAGLWKEVKDRLRAPGGGLSGGQQQRLCIARSLAIKPKVLLMDEPCSALDPTSTRVIEETMGELQKEVTIVIVTHNMQQAQRVSQQCAFFLAAQGQPGHIVEHGDTEAMFDSPIDSRTYDYVNGRFG